MLNDPTNSIFRAPELFEVPSNCEIDERSDVWSLGCTLYAMAYGEFVLDGKGGEYVVLSGCLSFLWWVI